MPRLLLEIIVYHFYIAQFEREGAVRVAQCCNLLL